MTFSQQHASLLLKYLGISCITGAVAHGFFSGTRSIITALLGIVLFVIWSHIESGWPSQFWAIIRSTVLAIMIGCFTGWVQHFPDSPERSIWVVPLGFIGSILAYRWSEWSVFSVQAKKYALLSSLVVIALSIGSFLLIWEMAPHTH